MHHVYRDRLRQRCEQRGVVPTTAQLDRLAGYVDLLLQWRRVMNLTGLQQPESMIDILIGESLDFLQRDILPVQARVLDLGTGAGVPGVPLAICAPDLHLTLLDRSEKKMTFLRHLVPRLGLLNCQPLCESAEVLGRRLAAAEHFDVVVTRGVGRVASLLSLAAPLLRAGGRLLLRKAQATPELQEAAPDLASATWAEVTTRLVSQDTSRPWVLLVFRRGVLDTKRVS